VLIHHNELRDLERRNASGDCLPYNAYVVNGGVGVHVREGFSHDVVLYANRFEDVCWEVKDFGTDTVLPATPGAGRVPPELKLRRIALDVVGFTWPASPCSGVADYAVYEGMLGDWTSHTPLTCFADPDRDLQATLGVSSGDRYDLVVPANPYGEGSYGLRRDRPTGPGERQPPSGETCTGEQDLSCL
jgi:hypothetical protein